jgi:hypothetical protein
MIHKGSICLIFLAFALWGAEARAERRSVHVFEASSSGRLVRISIGSSAGLKTGDPVLFSAGGKKIAAGRVFRAESGSAIIAVLERYGDETPTAELDYDLLFGEPFDEAANLPDYVIDREEERPNPANERFLVRRQEETSPELDDDNYTPEVTLRPRFPDPRTYNTHNITIGLSLFRNRALPTADQPSPLAQRQSSYTTYQGYSVRYAYTFRTHYWLRTQAPALVSVEGTFGVYNFDHTFPDERIAQVRVIPLGMNLRYLIEVSKLFRLYPYLGYHYNVVSAVNGNLTQLEAIQGGRLLGGAGAQLVMSNTIDARLEGGSDGLMGGIVVKF